MNIGNNINQMTLAQEPFNLRSIQQNFQISFGIAPDVDQVTPTIAMACAQEIQNTLQSRHPLRIYMFNFLSVDGYLNNEFQSIVRTTVLRLVLALRNGEFQTLQQAVPAVIPACMKFAASYLASQEPAMIDYLDTETINRVVPANAQLWLDICAMCDGTIPFQPLNAYVNHQNTTAIAGAIGRGQALNANHGTARTLGGGVLGGDMSTSGAFATGVRNARGGNEGNTVNPGSVTSNRFQKKLQELKGALPGAMQTAMNEAANNTTPRRSVDMLFGTRQQQAKAPATQQQTVAEEVLEEVFEHTNPVVVVESSPAPTATPAFVYTGDDGVDYGVMEEVSGINENMWRGSAAQRFHPAWCRRTHYIRYFRLQNNKLLAVPTKYSDEELEIAMNYDAHAVDPRMGKPDPRIAPTPVKEPAKVLYAEAKNISINVVRAENWAFEQTVEAAMQSTLLDAESTMTHNDALSKNHLVNTPVVYPDVVSAHKDLETIGKISAATTFVEAASLLNELTSDVARETLNQWLTKRLNRALSAEMGVTSIMFTNFLEDAGNVLPDLRQDAASDTSEVTELMVDTLAAMQNHLIKTTVNAFSAASDEMQDYVASLFIGTEEQVEALAGRTLFLQRGVTVTWVKFTAEEMSIGVPTNGSAVVAESVYASLHAIIKAVLKDGADDTSGNYENILMTRDGKKFGIQVNAMAKQTMLISRYNG